MCDEPVAWILTLLTVYCKSFLRLLKGKVTLLNHFLIQISFYKPGKINIIFFE